MKLAATLVLGTALVVSTHADAQEVVMQPVPMSQPIPMGQSVPMDATGTIYSAPAPMRGYSRTRSSGSQDTFFGRLMELERRKNAWLMRTFLGR
jgi:hypothetical protein